MSRLVKSNRLILDDQAYQLAPQILVVPVHVPEEAEEEDGIPEHEPHLTRQQQLEEEIQKRLDETEEEVLRRLDEAERDREAMLQDAYAQAQSVLESARENGYEEGRQAGFDEGRAIAESLIQEALAVKAAILEEKRQLAARVEGEAVQLILDTVERILNKHVQEDYDLIHGIVGLAMEKLTYTESLSLRVAVEDYDMAISMKDQILALAENVDDIRIKPDKSLKPGSCIIDTPAGSIDSGVWTQFEQVKNAFEELLSSE